ncbi:MAG: hypothetical protein GVY23_06885 [Spirochaetes bacterium]|jgi:hypothetical protein|nr:hypothetical protein [Spirochaetota bacterium]
MNLHGVAWRGPTLIGCLFLTYLLSSTALLLFTPPAQTTFSAWSGFYSLLLPRAEERPGLVGALRAEGFDGVLSRGTATVRISNFSGLEEVPLIDLDERLAPMDPRWDPFLRDLPDIFTGGRDGRYEIVYLRSDAQLGEVRRRVRRAAEAVGGVDGWELAESHTPLRAVYLIGFAAIVAAVVLPAGRTRRQATAGALPWLGTVALGGGGTFVAAALIYFAWVMFGDNGRRYLDHRLQYGNWPAGRRELRHSALMLAATWAIVLGFHPTGSLATLAPILISSVGLAAWTGLSVALAVFKRRKQDHRLFVPVTLRAKPAAISAVSRYASTAAWVALLVVSTPLVATLLPQSSVPGIPRPVPMTGRGDMSLETLGALALSGGDGAVHVADYVAHRAYQEGFVYGASFGVPSPGSTLTLSRFRKEGALTVREQEVMLRYDREWLDEVLTAPETGIGALLVNGNVPSGVVRTPKPGIYSLDTHPARYTLQALLAFSPFLFLGMRVLITGGSGRPTPVLNRKRQAA